MQCLTGRPLDPRLSPPLLDRHVKTKQTTNTTARVTSLACLADSIANWTALTHSVSFSPHCFVSPAAGACLVMPPPVTCSPFLTEPWPAGPSAESSGPSSAKTNMRRSCFSRPDFSNLMASIWNAALGGRYQGALFSRPQTWAYSTRMMRCAGRVH